MLGAVGLRMDAKFTAVLERQLEFIKTRTYDIMYPEMKARQFIPVNNDVDTGAETITYRQWDMIGMAQIIANYGDDMPLIDELVEEFEQKVQGLGAAYEWSIQDLRRSAMAGASLDQRRARAARRSIEQQIENFRNKDSKAVAAMDRTRDLASEMKRALLTGTLQLFGERLHEAWGVKQQMAGGISNPEIDAIYVAARPNPTTPWNPERI